MWTPLSVVALLAAALPPAYFALRLRAANPSFARLAAFLALALSIHAGFHLADMFVGVSAVVVGVEAISAAFILAFAGVYWQLGRGG